jgi:hypothetical protein
MRNYDRINAAPDRITEAGAALTICRGRSCRHMTQSGPFCSGTLRPARCSQHPANAASPSEWQLACQREAVIHPLAEANRLSRLEVDRAARMPKRAGLISALYSAGSS